MGDIKDTNDGSEKVTLKRQVGLVSCVALIIGTIIGSGIFISPVYVLQQTQSVGMSLVIWFLGGVLAMIGKYTEPETKKKKHVS